MSSSRNQKHVSQTQNKTGQVTTSEWLHTYLECGHLCSFLFSGTETCHSSLSKGRFSPLDSKHTLFDSPAHDHTKDLDGTSLTHAMDAIWKKQLNISVSKRAFMLGESNEEKRSRNDLPIACCSELSFHQGSSIKTLLARVKLIPTPAALREHKMIFTESSLASLCIEVERCWVVILPSMRTTPYPACLRALSTRSRNDVHCRWKENQG